MITADMHHCGCSILNYLSVHMRIGVCTLDPTSCLKMIHAGQDNVLNALDCQPQLQTPLSSKGETLIYTLPLSISLLGFQVSLTKQACPRTQLLHNVAKEWHPYCRCCQSGRDKLGAPRLVHTQVVCMGCHFTLEGRTCMTRCPKRTQYHKAEDNTFRQCHGHPQVLKHGQGCAMPDAGNTR